MGRIQNKATDKLLDGLERLLGTNGDNTTYNYKLSDIANYILGLRGDRQMAIESQSDLTVIVPLDVEGTRYISTTTGTSVSMDIDVTATYIYELNDGVWVEIIPSEGFNVWDKQNKSNYYFDGTGWINIVDKEQILDFMGEAILDGTQTGIQVQYDDAGDAFNFTVNQYFGLSYANLASAVSSQGDQNNYTIYEITDASSFTDITSGRAWVQYLGTTNGDETDYRIISSGQSNNPTLQEVTDEGTTTTNDIVINGLEINDGTDDFGLTLKSIPFVVDGQPFFESNEGYALFSPNKLNTAQRNYIFPNGTPTGTSGKFEIFNTDYEADSANYNGFNVFTNNTDSEINIGSNRGGTGTRLKMIIGGDYNASSLVSSSSKIVFNTDNTMEVFSRDFSVDESNWTVFTPLRLGQSTVLAGRVGVAASEWLNNAYYDGAWKRIELGYAQRFSLDTNGDIKFWTTTSASADNTITWEEKLTIKNDGQITAPNTTIADVTSGGAKAILTKEAADSYYGSAPIPTTYADLAALIAGQGSQTINYIYEVTDGSGFTGVDSGKLWVKYLGTTVGDETDYSWETRENNATTIKTKTTNYTLKNTDVDGLLRMDADFITNVFVPHTDNENIPIGREIQVKQIGLGEVKILTDDGVVLETPSDVVTEIFSQYDAISLRHETTDVWGIYGALKDSFTLETPALLVGDVSISTLYWPKIYKSSDWGAVTTTKDYFVIYSTDHDAGVGGIYWGEFDDFDGNILNGFSENGLIVEDYQAETPYLVEIPTSESGLGADTLFLYYHTNDSDPSNAVGAQETHLITSTGGALHSATWNDQGKPLGLLGGETHTGYLKVYKRGVGDYLGIHLTVGGGSSVVKFSTSSDGLAWTRGDALDKTVGVPVGSEYQREQITPFVYNATLYGLVVLIIGSDKYFSICELDSDYVPSSFVKSIYKFIDGTRHQESYIEGDFLRCLYKTVNTNSDYYMITYKLSELL